MPDLTEAQLDVLKAKFYRALLDNDLLSRLIMANVGTDAIALSLPEAAAEPWISTHVAGIRLSAQRALPGGVTSFTAAVYRYVEVLHVVRTPGDRTLLDAEKKDTYFDGSDAFMALDATDDERKKAAYDFMMAWQQFLRDIAGLGASLELGVFTTIPGNGQP